jgi:hypothetical protein
MPVCSTCGGEIEFIRRDGRNVPIHLGGGGCGGWGSGGGGGGSGGRGGAPIPLRTARVFTTRSGYTIRRLNSEVSPSRCPKCGDWVYFVRHNGGSVWVDELGWPWPKHACFSQDPAPAWHTHLHRHTADSGRDVCFFGRLNPAAVHTAAPGRAPGAVELTLDADARGVLHLAAESPGGPAIRPGCLGAADLERMRLVLADLRVIPIISVDSLRCKAGLHHSVPRARLDQLGVPVFEFGQRPAATAPAVVARLHAPHRAPGPHPRRKVPLQPVLPAQRAVVAPAAKEPASAPEGWGVCPQCNTKVLSRNLKRHIRRVHNKAAKRDTQPHKAPPQPRLDGRGSRGQAERRAFWRWIEERRR